MNEIFTPKLGENVRVNVEVPPSTNVIENSSPALFPLDKSINGLHLSKSLADSPEMVETTLRMQKQAKPLCFTDGPNKQGVVKEEPLDTVTLSVEAPHELVQVNAAILTERMTKAQSSPNPIVKGLKTT